MFGELVNIHREITEAITFELAFNLSFTMLIIILMIKLYYRFIVKKECFFVKDMRRNFLLVIREISSFIRSIINSTLILLGFFSEKTFVVNIVKLYIVCISLLIIKKTIGLILERGESCGDIR